MKITIMPELKPCPFCGEEAAFINIPVDYIYMEFCVSCVCPKCGAGIRYFDDCTVAAEAWNNRVNM